MSSLAEPLDLPRWSYSHRRPILGRVILLAVVIHSFLLLIPRQPQPTGSPPHSVRVELQYAPPAPRPEIREIPEPVTETVPANVPVEPAELIESRPGLPAPQVDPAEEPAAEPPLTAAYLLDQVRERDWSEPRNTPQLLGVPYVPDLPWNLSRPVLPLSDNAFDPVYITGNQEIIDQWMEPSGVINAVIKTPNGEILCGSLQPWDPMNPLFEPVAMYRSCGGGGRRKPNTHSAFLSRD